MHRAGIDSSKSKLPFLFAVFFSASWPTTALPATPGNDAGLLETEEDFTGDIDTVISATRIRQPLTESPSSITIIDRDMIVASGAIEIADVMRLVPGMQVGYPTGNQMAVTYHGLGDDFPRDMQILIDGRSVYKPSYADVDWLFLGVVLEDIERIEVIRGPNTPLYGSNAVSGVINIITRLPYQDRGTSARITAGDLATRDGMIRHSGSNGALDYRVTLNYQESGIRVPVTRLISSLAIPTATLAQVPNRDTIHCHMTSRYRAAINSSAGDGHGRTTRTCGYSSITTAMTRTIITVT